MRNWVALATTVCAGLSLALAVINAGLTYNNRAAQQLAAQRLEFITQSQQVARAGQIVVAALAEAAQRNDDTAIRNLLTANGVTIRQAATPPPPPATAPSATALAPTAPDEPASSSTPPAIR